MPKSIDLIMKTTIFTEIWLRIQYYNNSAKNEMSVGLWKNPIMLIIWLKDILLPFHSCAVVAAFQGRDLKNTDTGGGAL